jgi:hypothetical protein
MSSMRAQMVTLLAMLHAGCAAEVTTLQPADVEEPADDAAGAASGGSAPVETPVALPVLPPDGSGGSGGAPPGEGSGGDAGGGDAGDTGLGYPQPPDGSEEPLSPHGMCRAYEVEALELSEMIDTCPSFDAGGCILYAESMDVCPDEWVGVFVCLLDVMSLETCGCGDDREFRCEGCDAAWDALLTCRDET